MLHFVIGYRFAVTDTTLWSSIVSTGINAVHSAIVRKNDTSLTQALDTELKRHAERLWIAKRWS